MASVRQAAERRVAGGLLVLALLLSVASGADAGEPWASREGLYRLSFTSELSPIAINTMHRWTLHLETADGRPVDGAKIDVDGGMPEHDHGLPTSPRVTQRLGDGDYLLEGMRFHMSGFWEITLSIDASLGRDTVVISLTI